MLADGGLGLPSRTCWNAAWVALCRGWLYAILKYEHESASEWVITATIDSLAGASCLYNNSKILHRVFQGLSLQTQSFSNQVVSCQFNH
jgi:hypothetical protein